jgi:hypothetical protein
MFDELSPEARHAGLARTSTERRDFAVDPLQIQQRAIAAPIYDCGRGN